MDNAAPDAMLLSISTPGESLGLELPLWSVLPFALLLLAIALLPLAAAHWWEKNRNKALVVVLLALPCALFVASHGAEAVSGLHDALLDYVSFLALLASLYVIAGGIYVRGSLAGSPLSNTAFLSIGAVLANLIGTTGASMVLIRPLLRANQTRLDKAHIIVFFIFVVSNCGGLLTPLGDPPLFLGFLKGVPFGWTLLLWKQWLFVNGALLVVFYLVDGRVFDREELARPGSQLEEVLRHEPLRIEGLHNVALLVCMIGVILGKAQWQWPFGVQEGAMLALAFVSWFGTQPALHRENRFRFAPILEVAILFLGIFVTMVAPLAILNARGAGLGITEPWQCYWASGALSSFLDNAPTYMTFAAAAAGKLQVSLDSPHYLGDYLAHGPQAARTLAAISCGAVMMGANTYIGNGPNFMVKAIAEDAGIRMPSFFRYMLWSLCVLIPVFVATTVLFFV
jgi:Na+/H+ antiporter NhaD/arsenite permease-like protein